jgi:hypothetical protein
MMNASARATGASDKIESTSTCLCSKEAIDRVSYIHGD